jgi:plastocyanin
MRLLRSLRGYALAATLLVSLAGIIAIAPARAADPVEVHIDNFTFAPQSITVSKGTTVVWINRDDTPHRVVAVKNQFKSPVLDTDETFRWTFADAGNFAYFCSMHPHMTGTVTVTEK